MTPCPYESYYCQQAGRGLPVFAGAPLYRGRGLGNVLAGLGRMVMPILKSGGKALLKEGVASGLKVAEDVLSGESVTSALKKRAGEAGKRLLRRVTDGARGPPPKKRKKQARPKKKRKADIFD